MHRVRKHLAVAMWFRILRLYWQAALIASAFDEIEEAEKTKRHLEAVGSLIISSDLSMLGDEYYLEVDPSKSTTDNANGAFSHTVSKLHYCTSMHHAGICPNDCHKSTWST